MSNHMFKHVKKRDGRVVDFDPDRIHLAVEKALKASGMKNEKLSKTITRVAIESLEKKSFTDNIPDIESIQDMVEKALIKRGLSKAAKLFIIYREQHKKMRSDKQLMMDAHELVSSYIEMNDWHINDNSDGTYSYANLINHISGSVISNYTLTNIYSEEISNSHKDGDIHIHDLTSGIIGHSAGWSLRQLLIEGVHGHNGRINAKPAKHFNIVLSQIVNFISSLQNEWSGSQTFSSFDTFLAPFIRRDKLDYKSIKQNIHQFVFNLNSITGDKKTLFTNLSFDWIIPEELKDLEVIIGGKKEENVFYKDFQEEVNLINRAFLEVMNEGDKNGNIFIYPIPIYNITENFNWECENAHLLFELTGKLGTPYFQNFIKSDLNYNDIRSMCHTREIDTTKLHSKTGGLFGSGEETGSIGRVTINMPRLGYISKNENEFFSRLGMVMDTAKESLEVKRKVVQRHLDGDLLPYTKMYLGTLNKHFSTIGLIGLNEACLNFLGCSVADPEGIEFSLKVLDYMREKILKFQKTTGHLYNLEATPAEETSYRLAKIDKKKYPEIITAGDTTPYYTNSSWLPVGFTDDLFEALDLQESLQAKYTGGTVFHAFVGERINNQKQVARLVKVIAEKYRIPYYTITPSFSICPIHGYIPGEHHECPYESLENEFKDQFKIIGP